MIDLSPEDMQQRLAELRAENQQLKTRLNEEEISHSNTLDQRDRAEQAADKLSQSIMGITGRDIGEHSNAHCPWGAAIEHAGEYESRLRSLLIACDTAARRLEAAGHEPDAERFRRALQSWPSSENKEAA